MLKIRELREENNLSQEDLANKLEMKQQRISAYENEKREPDIETLKIFADFFDVSIDYLLGRTDIRNLRKDLDTKYKKDKDKLSKEEIDRLIEILNKQKEV